MKKKSTKSAPKAAKRKKKQKPKSVRDLRRDVMEAQYAAPPPPPGAIRELIAYALQPTTARTRTGKWKEKFLEVLGFTCNVTLACRAAAVDRKTVYKHRDADKDFAARWDDAVTAGVELLEAEMLRRAAEGVNKPIFQQGIKIGEVTEYSDSLAMFLAKAHKPEKYRERVSVKNDNPARQPLDPVAKAAAIAHLLGELQSGAPAAGAPDGGEGSETGG